MMRSCKATIVASIAILACVQALAEPEADIQTRCFRFKAQPEKLLQLRLLTVNDGENSAAFIRHVGSKTWIPLVLLHEEEIPMAQGSARTQYDMEWLEVIGDQITGRYSLGMFGAEVVFFNYVNAKTGKIEFGLVKRVRGVDPCRTR
jgi:hypothetical protein